MALFPLQLRPGVNKEVTPYANKGGYIDCDKVRFRAGFPEKIGGWQSLASARFSGTCRAIFDWSTIAGLRFVGLGTNLKYYVFRGGTYHDITPVDRVTAAGDVTFLATAGSNLVTVTDASHGARAGDYVTFSGAVSLGGAVGAAQLNREFEIVEVVTASTYKVQVAVLATAGDVGNGGGSVVASYQVPVGSAQQEPTSGWGSGGFGEGAWGQEAAGTTALRIWNHANYGEDLLYGPRGGALYYWDSSAGTGTRGVKVTGGDAPLTHQTLLVSDTLRIVVCFGCNPYAQTQLDPMLVRWSDAEQYNTWTPLDTNQAGEYRLALGSRIMCGRQSRQEILCWTDTALYSMRYIGAPLVFGFNPLASEISIAGADVAIVVNGVAYWMGIDTFYRYDGRVAVLPCSLQKFVFRNINLQQAEQFFVGSVEAYNEVWWFYVSAGSTVVDRYVIFNYVEGTWAHGTLHRTAWWDSPLYGRPLAAYQDTILQHETGADDLTTSTPAAISAHIESAPVDIGSGDRAAFVWRMLPDVTFEGSTSLNPRVTLQLRPFAGTGAPLKTPQSVGGESASNVVRTTTAVVEQYTPQVNIRVRGRQVSLRIESNQLGVAWQLGVPRVDMRPDGRRG